MLAVAPHLTVDDFSEAIAAGDAFLAAAPATAARDDYHRVLLDHLEVEATASLSSELTRPVEASTIVVAFPEVIAVLEEILIGASRWPSCPMPTPSSPTCTSASACTASSTPTPISAVLGCYKPDPRMFRHASDALSLRPEECLFVDDDPALVLAAIELGYGGVALIRPPAETAIDVPKIAELSGLLNLL